VGTGANSLENWEVPYELGFLGRRGSSRLRPGPRCASGTMGVALRQAVDRLLPVDARVRIGPATGRELESQGGGSGPVRRAQGTTLGVGIER
jgi:hypothetical protein